MLCSTPLILRAKRGKGRERVNYWKLSDISHHQKPLRSAKFFPNPFRNENYRKFPHPKFATFPTSCCNERGRGCEIIRLGERLCDCACS